MIVTFMNRGLMNLNSSNKLFHVNHLRIFNRRGSNSSSNSISLEVASDSQVINSNSNDSFGGMSVQRFQVLRLIVRHSECCHYLVKNQ